MIAADRQAGAISSVRPETIRLRGGSYEEVKDPCVVRLHERWHLYGTGVTAPHTFEILHASADSLRGAWSVEAAVALPPGLRGSCLGAPGLIVDGEAVHMFLQTDYNVLGGRIEHLLSHDGAGFLHSDTALHSGCSSAGGIYDAHPAAIGDERYLVYSAFDVIGEPDIHLARSLGDSWSGPWESLGAILTHKDVPFHNSRGTPGYEWGLEGAQLLELPDGRILLNAVCFLATGEPGSRQRLFTGVASRPEGPYTVRAPALAGEHGGELGHASVLLEDEELVVFLQQRTGAGRPWHYASARVAPEAVSPPRPEPALR